ncbi:MULTISPECIES: NACHT domain-containing protein [Streptomyces]|uniref:NACHT domain-containing protein n=1 Tax=Streptomyces TaxID=1883 RepID=UPI00344379AF
MGVPAGPVVSGVPDGPGGGALRADGVDAWWDQGRDAMPLEVGDALARAVRRQWQEAARQRKLQQEIPVRWHRTRRPVAGEGVVWGDPDRPRLVRWVPNVAALGDGAAREGGIPELLSVYGGVASGRVVVLGAPGAGKSDAALLTVLRALDHRDTLREDTRRAQCPVPVLLSIVGWDGRRLDDWLAARLADDYRVGRKQAEELIEGGWISLFLDSFDEMAGDLRHAALREIDRAAYRVVIFSRPDEFEAAVADGHLLGAVALELSPVPTAEAVAFLRTMPALAPWQRLITHLENEPDSTLSQTLSTPLILTLLRDAFPPRRITDLDDMLAGRFVSRHEVEEYLLGRLVKIRYRPGSSTSRPAYEPRKAERWLGYVAGRMNEQETYDHGRPANGRTYSLDWRRLHYWASPWPRIAATALTGALLGASGCVLAYGPGRHIAWDGFRGIEFGAVYGSIVGISFGAGAGALAELRDPVPRWRKRLHVQDAPHRRRFHPATGILVAIAVTVMALPDITNPVSWTVAIAAGLLTGALAGFAATRIPAAPGWTGWSRWRGLHSWPVLAPAGLAGTCVALSFWQDNGTPDRGLPIGIVSMLTVGIVGVVIVAARPASLADPVTDPYTSWRQDRNFALVTGTIFGFCISLALGVNQVIGATSEGAAADGPDWGTLPFIVIGFGLPFAYAGGMAISDHWRTSLLFLQLRLRGDFPLLGMRFLKDAYDHRIFRAEGASYQFRHALLQDKLARDQEHSPPL